MFCEPPKAQSPSTTRILRWLRRSGRRNSPCSSRIGIIARHSMVVPESRWSISL